MKLTRRSGQRLDMPAPFGQLTRLRDQLNRLFELGPFGMPRPSELLEGWGGPAVDVFEDKDHYTVKAELPGLRKEDIDVSVHGNVLSISGERKEEEECKEGECFQSERYYGRFQRSVELPQSVDMQNVSASYKDGVLTITLPKTEEAKRRQIQVQGM